MNRILSFLFHLSIYLLFSIYLFPVRLQAQQENIWAFGDHAGLDFNGLIPTSIKTNIGTREGCASVADEQGHLLFYTDGTSVWDRNNNVMPNGSDLPGLGVNITNSTVQGALIVPFPGNGKKYYVFSLGEIESGLYFGDLFYSIVDMDLNNGLGDLSMTGKLLDTGLTESMTGVAGNNCDVWLLAISATTGIVRAHNISTSGITSNPVLSPGSLGLIKQYGTIDVSPDRRRVAVAKDDLLLMDFDPETGMATNPLLLNAPIGYYAVCFSPDGSKLYASSGSILQQFDLSSGDTQKMKSSRMTISAQAYGMKRGPDAKIYVTTGLNGTSSTLNVINKPNLAGMDCQISRPGIQLLPGTAHNLGLPNVVSLITNRRVYTTTRDTIFCPHPVLLIASNLSGTHYRWNDNSNGTTRKVDSPGVYWVSYQVSSSCILDDYHVDSFIISYPEKDYHVSFTADTLICLGTLLPFHNTSDPHFSSFHWDFGDGDSSAFSDPEHRYPHAGIYDVRLIGKIDSICTDTTHKSITVDSQLSGRFRLQPERICVGETVFFYPDAGDSTIERLHWQFGDGTEMSSGIEHKLQHAYDTAGRLPVTLTTSFRACPDTAYTDTVEVYPLPYVDLGRDTAICLQGAPVTLTNLAENRPGTYHYLWNTGDTSKEIQVRHPGEYSLKVSAEPLGCYTRETVKVTKDCYIDIPNAFTPNGDGNNDYFLPRKLLSKGVTGFKMDIYNRWGEKVFSTNNPIGRGWDGRFNGVPQPQGVYVYIIDVRYKNNRTEHYQGNVTLIR